MIAGVADTHGACGIGVSTRRAAPELFGLKCGRVPASPGRALRFMGLYIAVMHGHRSPRVVGAKRGGQLEKRDRGRYILYAGRR